MSWLIRRGSGGELAHSEGEWGGELAHSEGEWGELAHSEGEWEGVGSFGGGVRGSWLIRRGSGGGGGVLAHSEWEWEWGKLAHSERE